MADLGPILAKVDRSRRKFREICRPHTRRAARVAQTCSKAPRQIALHHVDLLTPSFESTPQITDSFAEQHIGGFSMAATCGQVWPTFGKSWFGPTSTDVDRMCPELCHNRPDRSRRTSAWQGFAQLSASSTGWIWPWFSQTSASSRPDIGEISGESGRSRSNFGRCRANTCQCRPGSA